MRLKCSGTEHRWLRRSQMYRPYESAARRRVGRGNRKAKAAGVAKLDLGTRSTPEPMAHDPSDQMGRSSALLPAKGVVRLRSAVVLSLWEGERPLARSTGCCDPLNKAEEVLPKLLPRGVKRREAGEVGKEG